MIMKLEFRVKEFKSNRQPRSFTDMMTMQESGTFNIQYRIEGKGRYKTLNKVFKSKVSAESFIESTLLKYSILYVGTLKFVNGQLN